MTKLVTNCALLSFWLCFLCTQGFSQSFYNLDFEYSKPSGYPYVWQTNEGNGNSTITVVSSVSYNGKKCLQLHLNNSPMSLAGLLFPNDLLKGKTVEVSGYIKTDSLQNGIAQLFYYDYSKRALVASEEIASGSTPWKLFTFRFNIDPNSKGEGIVMGIKANGTGKVLFDEVRIHIGTKIVQDKILPYKELSRAELTTLSRLSISIPAVQSNTFSAAFSKVKHIIGGATIVGLGENSHGSGSIFELKSQIVEYLVEEMGFTVLGMEAPAPEADRINHYIQGEEGDFKDIIKYLSFKSWQTKEVLELIQWMKEYNRTHKTKAQFRGFDIQSKEVAIDNLQAFGKRQDYPMIDVLVDSITYLLSGNQVSDSTRKIALVKANLLKAQFESLLRRKPLLENKDSITYLSHNAEILAQYIGLPFLKNRREAMADNIKWIKENNPADTKIIIWAHNDHVSKIDESTGSYLNHWYGKEYLPIGVTFYEGTYAAYGKEKYYIAESPYLGTYEYYLSKVNLPQYIIDLRELSRQKQVEWVKQSLDFRNLGAEPQTNQFRPIDIFKSFDALIYLKKSEHATYIEP